MIRSHLSSLLANLEGKCACKVRLHKRCSCAGECDCPHVADPPCEHIVAAGEQQLARIHAQGLSVDDWLLQWGQILIEVQPGEYEEPPPSETPAAALVLQDRVAIYRQRLEARHALFNEEDAWNRAREYREAMLSRRQEEGAPARLRNGRPNPQQSLCIANDSAPDEGDDEDSPAIIYLADALARREKL